MLFLKKKALDKMKILLKESNRMIAVSMRDTNTKTNAS